MIRYHLRMSTNRTTALILAHLGLAAACHGADGSAVVSAPIASAAPSSSAAASASGSASPVASASASALPTSKGKPAPATGAGTLGKPCGAGDSCAPGLYCQRNFNGASFSPGGTCIEHPPVYEGRPLVVDGAPRRAPAVRGSWSSARPELAVGVDVGLAAEIARGAFEEHASVAAFARTLCELVALGAPEPLVHQTHAALGDEIRHAREAFDLASALGGAPIGPGPLPEAVAPLRAGPALARNLLVDVLRGGCVGEALAAARAAARAEDPTLPAAVRAFYTKIAGDEARHAALAFETARFLVDREPPLAEVVAEVFAELGPDARALVGDVFARVFDLG